MVPKEVRCPNCGMLSPYEGNPHRPFCSKSCRMRDLGAWASEEYKIAGKGQEVEETNLSSSDTEDSEDPSNYH